MHRQFYIYHAHQLDVLKSQLANLIKNEPLDSLFNEEVIIVQSHGMSQWLQIQLAESLDIVANVQMPFANQFTWDLHHLLIPSLNHQNRFTLEFMTWSLMSILPKMVENHEFDLDKFQSIGYLFDIKEDKKLYQLANNIARVFDQYIIYRPDWLNSWEHNQEVDGLSDEQIWQAKIWRALIHSNQESDQSILDRRQIHQKCLTLLNNSQLNSQVIKKLPKRLVIFGATSLPPFFLDLFYALSKHIPVHLFFMNPCHLYWGDLRSFTSVPLTELAQREIINPLLSSWGTLGSEHLVLLEQYTEKQDIELFDESLIDDITHQSVTLLHKIQQSIYDLESYDASISRLHSQSSKHKHVIASGDLSVSVHLCHSPLREVEVLYDYLLTQFQQNPDLKLNECVVMTPNIERYAPYIQAVFDNAPKHRSLPYALSDRKLSQLDPAINGFLMLLNLPTTYVDLTIVFELLSIGIIKQRFNLSDHEIDVLQHWCNESGIRFGIEPEQTKSYHWIGGFKRMLLGYALEGDHQLWHDISPYNDVQGGNAELVGRLIDFIELLARWNQRLQQSKSIQEWSDDIHQLITDFFLFDSETDYINTLLVNQLNEIVEQIQSAHYSELISIGIISELFTQQANDNVVSNRFLMGKINFCTLMPMRSVPFKIVCLLGMNDNEFPRQNNNVSFDLMQYKARIGDRNRRNDDRYLFLEALLSATHQFYVSYIGFSIQNNDTRYPSVLISELLDFISSYYVIAGDEQLSPNESANKLNKHLCIIHPRTPYHQDNFIGDTPSFADEWLPMLTLKGQKKTFLNDIPTREIDNLSIDDLINFYAHSIKYFFKMRLNVKFEQNQDELPDSELFNLDSLGHYYLYDDFLFYLIDSHVDETDDNAVTCYLEWLSKSNKIPDSVFGELIFEQARIKCDLIYQTLKPLIPNCQIRKVERLIQMASGDIKLSGTLSLIEHQGGLLWRAAKIGTKQKLKLWIQHLMLCAESNQANLNSRYLGIDGDNLADVQFASIESKQAELYLNDLVSFYLIGINQPLFMPLNSTFAALPKTDESTQRQTWHTSFYPGYHSSGENDEYYRRLYPEISDELVDQSIEYGKKILMPMIEHEKNS